jgi:molybdopterin molybdotransferase
MAMLSVAEALARVTQGLVPLEAEVLALKDASGRVLAEELVAQLNQPPFDASAMDGYAVCGADLTQFPTSLKLIGESLAGRGFDGSVGPGEAVRIFTGAPVPKGADSVVIQEDTDQDGTKVLVRAGAPGRHIRPCGQDFKKGEVLLAAATRLNSRSLMLAAAMNYAALPVRRKPKVAILATGDEVMPPGSELAPDQIVSSVPYGIAALVEVEGGEAMSLGIAKDDVESLVTLARTGSAADILVTVGGASVGERDLVAGAFRGEGLELDFWKIAMRPGKPMLYGRMGHQRVLGLPGNPVSAIVCARIFLVPMLRRLLGLAAELRTEEAVLGEALEVNGPRVHYMRAVSDWTKPGERVVRPLASQDSSLVADLARADCLIVRRVDAPAAREGSRVQILPLDD